MTSADPVALAAMIGTILENLNLRYVIGGSVAASIYGEPRSTLDLDLMIEADREAVRTLVRQLAAEFYVEEEDAIHAIHLRSALKIDCADSWIDAERSSQAVGHSGFTQRKTSLCGSWSGFAWAANSRTGNGATSSACFE